MLAIRRKKDRRNRIILKLTRKFKKKTIRYPCLCEVLSPFLKLTRILGILPVGDLEKKGHVTTCGFTKNKFWSIYSFGLQTTFMIYLLFIYGPRFYSGPEYKIKSEWYVMIFGHLITDFETLLTVFLGNLTSNKVCKILKKLAAMHGSVGETRIFQGNLRKIFTTSAVFYLCLLTSHGYVSIIRSGKAELSLLDSPSIAMIRGTTLLYPIIEVSIVFVFTYLISSKYEHLSNLTTRTMKNLFLEAGGRSKDILIKYTDAVSLNISKGQNIPKLHQLEKFNQKITESVNELNKTVGFSILTALSSSLYTSMYYLYRFSTASDNSLTSNKKERIHYAIGLIFRTGKMLSYMFMGHALFKSSQRPLEVLRKSRIINLPHETQQQIQTLMMHWLEAKGYLSAPGGIVRVGPWLLAPILGNIITYLLVALQFNQSNLEIIAIGNKRNQSGV